MAKEELKTASVLAFERKLSNSDALMYSGRWQDRDSKEKWKSIIVQNKDIRGTISNRPKNSKDSDPAKLNADIQKPNLQNVDVAFLPFDVDTLKVCFSLRVLGNISTPCTCNNPLYEEALSNVINGYVSEHGFDELAKRYAFNIISGRFLWRNRIGAEEIEVKVRHIENQKITNEFRFNASSISLREFPEAKGDIAKVAEVIRRGLAGESFSFLEVDGFARLGGGQEVFPSQELVLDKDSSKSKTLYQVDGIAAMHSQKIGNALRTIDTWYPEAAQLGPIAIEPYGSVTNKGKAYRVPKDNKDFYNLLDNWVLKDKKPEIEQQHFVIANLIRGGVYGEAEKK